MIKNRRKFTQCPNCAYNFEEVNNYCPNCGQENHDLNVPFKHLIWEFLEGTMHFDTKVWRTLKYLMTKPGLVTEKFIIGQRASYVPPFRLYVFISILFFTTLALRSNNSVVVSGPGLQEVQAEIQAANSPDTTVPPFNQLAASKGPNKVFRNFIGKLEKFTKSENSKQKLLKNISFMMFLLMPFFGFILYMVYRKQNRNYVEHLMFSIHFHTFFFICVMLALFVEFIFERFNVDLWVLWIAVIYLFFALHRVYKQSYFRTLIKMIPIALLYLITSTIFILTTLGISILMS
jgi:hypothetical protein